MTVGFFGPSLIFGTPPVEGDDQTIPYWFQNLSKARYIAQNYGMPGYTSTQYLLTLNAAIIAAGNEAPFGEAVVYGTWNDCQTIVHRLPNSPFHNFFSTSDALPTPFGDSKALFIRELDARGVFVFDKEIAAANLSAKLGRIYYKLKSLFMRERVIRLLALLADDNFYPWNCCGPEIDAIAASKKNTSVRYYYLSNQSKIKTEATKVADAYMNNVALMRSIAKRCGFRILFVMNPMAYTKENPAQFEQQTALLHQPYLEPCFDEIRSRFNGDSDFLDLTKIKFPDTRVYGDTGHLNGLGNRVVATEILSHLNK